MWVYICLTVAVYLLFVYSLVMFCYTLQTVGCDNVLESGMETDACGICNGNNSLATFVSDSSSRFVFNLGMHS